MYVFRCTRSFDCPRIDLYSSVLAHGNHLGTWSLRNLNHYIKMCTELIPHVEFMLIPEYPLNEGRYSAVVPGRSRTTVTVYHLLLVICTYLLMLPFLQFSSEKWPCQSSEATRHCRHWPPYKCRLHNINTSYWVAFLPSFSYITSSTYILGGRYHSVLPIYFHYPYTEGYKSARIVIWITHGKRVSWI